MGRNPHVEFGRAAEGLSSPGPAGTLARVVHDDEGEAEAALEVAVVATTVSG
jgi:hypothetical protein